MFHIRKTYEKNHGYIRQGKLQIPQGIKYLTEKKKLKRLKIESIICIAAVIAQMQSVRATCGARYY